MKAFGAMTWTIEGDDALPALANGEYALAITAADLDSLRQCATVGELERALYDQASQARNATAARNALRAALNSDGRKEHDQFVEIWGLLRSPRENSSSADDD